VFAVLAFDYSKAAWTRSAVPVTVEVFAVHTARPGAVGAVEVVFCNEKDARKYAADRSCDHRVLSASVTSFTVGVLGTRRPVCWFQLGEEQEIKFGRPGMFGR
jgi:nitrous oxide reductase accessory protein NosL